MGAGHDDHDDGARHHHDSSADDDHDRSGNDDDRSGDDHDRSGDDDDPGPCRAPRPHTPTTTTTAAKASSSSTAWGWILLAVVLVLAVGLVALLIARTRRQGRAADWQRSVLPAVTAAELARDLVLSQTETDDQQRRASVGVQVDEAVTGLERAAATAPDEASRALSTRAAEGLRGLAFAVEADHLMRSGGEHPTGAQLASADAARRNRSAELAAALAELKASIAPPRPGSGRFAAVRRIRRRHG